MKNYLFILGVLSFLNFSIHAEETPEISESPSASIEENKEPSFNVYLYGKAGFGLGFGVCGRSRTSHVGIEANFAMSTPNFDIFFNEVSIAALFYTKPYNRSSLYAGIGAGGYMVQHFIYTVPVFFGYQWQSGFVDLGALVIVSHIDGQYTPIPNLRVGFCF